MRTRKPKPALGVGKSSFSWPFLLALGLNAALLAGGPLPEIPNEIDALPVDLDGDGASTFGDKLALTVWCEMGGDLEDVLAFAIPEGQVLSLYDFFASFAAGQEGEAYPDEAGSPEVIAGAEGSWSCGGSAQDPCMATLPDDYPPGTTIQQAVDSLPDGGVLCIRPNPDDPGGVWRENVQIFLREITLRALPALGQSYVDWAPANAGQRTLTVTDGVVAVQGFEFLAVGGMEGAILASFTSLEGRDLCVEKSSFAQVYSQSTGGGAIRVLCDEMGAGGSTVELTENTFKQCRTNTGATNEGGGAVCILGGLSTADVRNNTFYQCYSRGDGVGKPGYGCHRGGAIYVAPGYPGPLWIRRCDFADNGVSSPAEEPHGAAVYLAATQPGGLTAHIGNSFFYADESGVEIEGKEFIYVDGNNLDAHLFGSTLRKVNAQQKLDPEKEHILLEGQSAPNFRLTDAIFWTDDETGNKAFDASRFPPERVHNNDVRRLSEEPNWTEYELTGNIDANPLFASGPSFHILDGSPCEDAGTASSDLFDGEELDELGVDLDEEIRFWPVDIGADESLIIETFIRGDADGDGVITIGDPRFILAYIWSGGPVPPPPFPDCGADPTPDGLDCWKYPPQNCE